MSSVTPQEIRREFARSKMGIAGIAILSALIAISVLALTAIPIQTLKEWNDPSSWLEYPKTAVPAWANIFLSKTVPEHMILETPRITSESYDGVTLASHQFGLNYNYDDFPNDIIYEFTAQYSGSPLLQVSVLRPDDVEIRLLSTSLPYSESVGTHSERVFSTDATVKKNIAMYNERFGFSLDGMPAEDVVFSKVQAREPLKGQYFFLVNLYGVDSEVHLQHSKLIVGGKAFGVMGTDELRRDLAVGLLWGTPLALFIGLVVAIASVVMGLLYGIYAGYRGGKTDEAMMRFNDVVYALPALPFLIILSVTVSNNIFVMIGFLMIFGWVGIAKVARSMALQIKTRGYVEAANMMGQKRSSIILKHILPQLLPYAFASIAISVPAAITTEAGLSFLGLGDPSFPTWGQILHDANVYGAASRGLWWWIVPPGGMIALTGLAFVFIGNALDVIVNPKLRR